jgi:hypothetical protein
MTQKQKEVLVLFLKCLAYPSILTLSSFVPDLNYYVLYGHGGIGWVLLSLSLTWVLGLLVSEYRRNRKTTVSGFPKTSVVILLGYALFTYPLSHLLMRDLGSIGDTMPITEVWRIYWIPISLLF